MDRRRNHAAAIILVTFSTWADELPDYDAHVPTPNVVLSNARGGELPGGRSELYRIIDRFFQKRTSLRVQPVDNDEAVDRCRGDLGCLTLAPCTSQSTPSPYLLSIVINSIAAPAQNRISRRSPR